MYRQRVRPFLLIDFGSTYTKITAVDAAEPRLLAQAKAPTTVDDINVGLGRALGRLRDRLGGLPRFLAKLACSSAAGGLRMAAVGLVPDLTAKAAREAILGAGARIIGTYAYRLTPHDIQEIEENQPDMILLAGGTDGGNSEVVLHNARMLAASAISVPIIFAGNQTVAGDVVDVLVAAGKPVTTTDNVMPRLHVLNVEPARQAVREIFLKHIIQAKGLDRAQEFIDGVVMPTPAAVLKAAQLLADGPRGGGLGYLAVIDIGGATTDVHSVSPSGALQPSVIFKGLEEPYAKRTVEGDLGMRSSAPALLAAVGEARLEAFYQQAMQDLQAEPPAAPVADLAQFFDHLSTEHAHVPRDTSEWAVDQALGRAAAEEAMLRHAGRLQAIQTPTGLRYLQYGKDLRPLKWLIGTGGIFVHSPRPEFLFSGTGFDHKEPTILRPEAAGWLVDDQYLLAAMGLLSEHEPEAAFNLLLRHLRRVDQSRQH